MEKIDMKKLFEAFQHLIKELKSIKDDIKVEISQLSDSVSGKIKNLQEQLDGMQHYSEDFDKFKSEIRKDIDMLRTEIEAKIQNLKVGLYEETLDKTDKKKVTANLDENLKTKEHHSGAKIANLEENLKAKEDHSSARKTSEVPGDASKKKVDSPK